jgi:hypothetical protein
MWVRRAPDGYAPVMQPSRLPRPAVVAAAVALALGAGLGACGGREQPESGNPGQGPQTPGVRTGTNPAQTARTATSGTSTLGASVKPAERKAKESPATKP